MGITASKSMWITYYTTKNLTQNRIKVTLRLMSIDKLQIKNWGKYLRETSGKIAIFDVAGAYPQLQGVVGIEDYAQRSVGMFQCDRCVPYDMNTLSFYRTIKDTGLIGNRELMYISRENFLEYAIDVVMDKGKQTGKPAKQTLCWDIMLFGHSRHTYDMMLYMARKYNVEDTSPLLEIWRTSGTDSEHSPNNKILVRNLLSEFENKDESSMYNGSLNPHYESASEFIANLGVNPVQREILQALEKYKERINQSFGKRVIVKPFLSGASGIGVASYDLSFELEAFAKRLSDNPENLIIEEALDIEREISMQIYITDIGEVLYLGLTEQRIDDNSHTGNLLSFEKTFEARRITKRQKEKVLRFAKYVAQKTGYNGYMSIDLVRTKQDSLKILEINARFGGASAPLMLLRKISSQKAPSYIEYRQFQIPDANPDKVLQVIGGKLLTNKNNTGALPIMISERSGKVGILTAHTTEHFAEMLMKKVQEALSK